jgi:hypothetical protein
VRREVGGRLGSVDSRLPRPKPRGEWTYGTTRQRVPSPWALHVAARWLCYPFRLFLAHCQECRKGRATPLVHRALDSFNSPFPLSAHVMSSSGPYTLIQWGDDPLRHHFIDHEGRMAFTVCVSYLPADLIAHIILQ